MKEDKSSYKHDASDKKLEQEADAATKAADEKRGTGPAHDPSKIARHDDTGKDRLFEKREQHDDAEKESEKTRLAKDVARHEHPVDDLPGDA